MKRVLTIIAAMSAILTAKAQTVELLVGEQQKVFFEQTIGAANSVTFGYLEATYNGGAMVKLFREQKFWEAPIYIHAEYQSTFDGNHTAILGGAYSFNLKNGFISLCPLYRYDFASRASAIQVSNVYFASWRWCELYGYNHFWYNGSPCFFGEERFHIKIGEHFRIGAIVDLTYFGSFKATPYLGVRYDF